MAGGAYSALSGMQSRIAELDRIASDLANIGTAGYKTERTASFAAERDFAATLLSAVDVATGGTRTDLRPGTIASTGRTLDLAIDGPGFFAVDTEHGVRYTRSGNFTRRADGMLVTTDGDRVLDAQQRPIRLGPGVLEIDTAGTLHIGGAPAGTIPVWQIDEGDLLRDTGSRFRTKAGVTPRQSSTPVVPGSLEQANVSLVERMATLTEVARNFESLQRGMSVLMNDLDARVIAELGRRT